MSDLTRDEWADLLTRYPAAVLEGQWIVNANAASGSTSFTVGLADTNTDPAKTLVPLVGASDAANFVHARILFGPGVVSAGGGKNLGFSTTVKSVATDTATPATTITLNDAVPQAVTAGDTFTIYRATTVGVTAPENIAQVGGTAVPTDFAGNPVVPTTQFDQLVQNATIGSTQIGFVASGEEVAYAAVTDNGVYRVNGALYCQTITLGAGGKMILGPGGLIQTGAFN